MLTRFVRGQLIIFAVVSVIGITTMIVEYLRVPSLLGVGHVTVTVELPATGGLYRFANVTYRGVQIGKVTRVEPTATGATAELTLDSSPQVPMNVQANVRSVSAVGEQYVDLVPRGDGPPFLADQSRIPRQDTTVPQKVGPMLDRLNALVADVPKQRLTDLLDESFKGFNGAGDDFGSLLDSGSRIAADANATAQRTRTLIEDTSPLLDSQAQSADALRIWTHELSAVTDVVVAHDDDFRKVITTGADLAQEASTLLGQLKPTLPVLLANLTTVGQIGVTYNPALEQLLVLLPPFVGGLGSMSGMNNPTGNSLGSFALMNGDPPPCTVGFLPQSAWRSPADETVIDTPDDLYCKLPQDSPIAVRGVRNNPCMDKPGKRAPSVEICQSDKPYEPLAMREHVFGPGTFDPNLVSQGVTPDSRVDRNDYLYGPVAGTPGPPPNPPAPEAPAADAPAPDPGVPTNAPLAPPADPPPPEPGLTEGAPAAPAAFSSNTIRGGPSMAVANYDPRTGRYVGADGLSYRQTDLTAQSGTTSWQGLLPH